ncbi:hypothetical protein HZB69_03120 [Candidatus Amesbacteria bacterium]|nr:hypothetical protein [Candidatus Amesbacteria bacterium]
MERFVKTLEKVESLIVTYKCLVSERIFKTKVLLNDDPPAEAILCELHDKKHSAISVNVESE